MSAKWVIAISDWFGPTIYRAGNGEFVWQDDDRPRALTFSDKERKHWRLERGEEWMPVAALDTLRSGEKR